MGIHKGQKLKEVTKEKRICIRLTEEQAADLEKCSEAMNTSKSEILMIGLNLVKGMLEETETIKKTL